MAKGSEDTGIQPGKEGVISIIGPGMKVIGDCEAEGTLRIEGNVDGTVKAGKAVVVGKDGVVDGDIVTQDAVIGGRVNGSITAESRLELQATCVIEGQVNARRIKLEEGGTVNGMVQIGEVSKRSPTPSYGAAKPQEQGGQRAGEKGGGPQDGGESGSGGS